MTETTPPSAEVVDLAAWPRGPGADGVVWTLASASQLNANLVHLGAGGEIGEHVNSEVDVLLVVVGGHGELTVEGTARALGPGTLAHVPAGARRRIAAAGETLAYLSVHRRREGPGIRPRRPGPA